VVVVGVVEKAQRAFGVDCGVDEGAKWVREQCDFVMVA